MRHERGKGASSRESASGGADRMCKKMVHLQDRYMKTRKSVDVFVKERRSPPLQLMLHSAEVRNTTVARGRRELSADDKGKMRERIVRDPPTLYFFSDLGLL